MANEYKLNYTGDKVAEAIDNALNIEREVSKVLDNKYDELKDAVELNEAVKANSNKIKENTNSIADLSKTVTENTSQIKTNKDNISQNTSDINKNKKSIEDNASNITKLSKAIDEVEAIAKGQTSGHVFDTKEEMDEWLAIPENVATLNQGDNLYIKDTDVPDYWWDGESAQELETDKVDLSGYASTEYVDERITEVANRCVKITKEVSITTILEDISPSANIIKVTTQPDDNFCVMGQNIWDEEWECPNTTVWSKYYIPVTSGVTYYFHCKSNWDDDGKHWRLFYIYFYNKYHEMMYSRSVTNNSKVIIPDGCYFIKFELFDNYGLEYRHNVCINISDERINGTYAPSFKTIYHPDKDGVIEFEASYSPITLYSSLQYDFECVYYKNINIAPYSNAQIVKGAEGETYDSAEAILNAVVGSGGEYTDYFVYFNDMYMHYRYIENEWKPIGSIGGGCVTSSTEFVVGEEAVVYESAEALLDSIVTSPNTFTDYFVNFNNVYSHYRYIESETGGDWIFIGNVYDLGFDESTNVLTLKCNGEVSSEIELSDGAEYKVQFDETTRHFEFLRDGVLQTEFTLPEGGGGSGMDYTLRIMNEMPSTKLTVATSTEFKLRSKFIEYFGADEVSNNNTGTLVVSYKLKNTDNWIHYKTDTVYSGHSFEVDITDIISKKEFINNAVNIELSVTGNESGITRTLIYEVMPVEAIIRSVNFNTTNVYSGDINFQYECKGRNLTKTVYFEIDNNTYTQEIGVSNLKTESMTLPLSTEKYSYGAHDFRVYYRTSEGAISNVLRYTILYNNGSNNAPMIGVIPSSDTITYGNELNIDYVVYTPNKETTDKLDITVYTKDGKTYDSRELTNIPNKTRLSWSSSQTPTSGDVYIDFKVTDNTTNKQATKTVKIHIDEYQSGYDDLNPVTAGLVYQYSAAGRSNNDSDKEEYRYDYIKDNKTMQIKGAFEGFNWASNGYLNDDALTLSGSALHTIKLKMFKTQYTDEDGNTIILNDEENATVTKNGRTFEIDFSVSNVTDINAHIVECMSNDHAGFVITPQVCYMLFQNGSNIEFDKTGFVENERDVSMAYIKDNKRIRLTFVIEPIGTARNSETGMQYGQCINIYINGQFANSYPYDDSANFNQEEFIKIGNDSCITKVYNINVYNRGLSTDEVLQNYKASPTSLQERIARFVDNDVLNDNQEVDYEKAQKKYPCLLITGTLSPYKDAPGAREDNKTESGVTLTKPDGVGGYVEEFKLLDKDADGRWLSCNNVQGTSSVKFPIKNYKVYLSHYKDNEDGTKEIEKYKYSLKGKDPETKKDLSIGESTLCWKADYMSSDHANTFNANLADTLFGDTLASQDPEQGGDPRVQNTIYGFRCLLFQRDDETSPINFIGDGALNNDKGNTKTFGLECDGDYGSDTLRQKWEFLNNTESLCIFGDDWLFKPVEIVTDSGATVTKKKVQLALESTYPDQGDLEEEGLEPKYDHLQVLYTWVCQRANFLDAPDTELLTPLIYEAKDDDGNIKTIRCNSQREYNKAIFYHEFEKHFNLEHALVYYLFNEFTALCDNRAKNMFLRCEDIKREKLYHKTTGEIININNLIDKDTGEVNADDIDWTKDEFAIWITDLYDLDSCFGVENSGYMQIPYYADWNYKLKDIPKFNGYESKLWLMFEEAFSEEIAEKARNLVDSQDGGLNYETLYDHHIKNNALLVCPTIVNRDMEYKYSDPWTDGYIDYSQDGNPTIRTKEYKYLQRGSRTEQKDSFIFKRSNMLYSKYRCNRFLNNNINFRVGANAVDTNGDGVYDAGGIPVSEGGITITASQVLFPAIKYADGKNNVIVMSANKTEAGVPVEIKKPGGTTDKIGYSDTIYIAGGTLLTDIGDISKLCPYEMQLQNAVNLKRLIVGSSTEGYENKVLNSLDTIENCALLEELNIENCISLANIVDLSNNGLIRKVYATGSGVSFIKLPNGGVLEDLYLGEVKDIKVLNHPNLKEFGCDSYSKLQSLHIENTPNIPVLDILNERLSNLTGGIRLVGINEEITDTVNQFGDPVENGEFTNTTLLKRLISEEVTNKYINDKGQYVADSKNAPCIAGIIRVKTINANLLNALNNIYGENLKIEYETLTHTVSYYAHSDATEPYCQVEVYDGETASVPYEDPVKPADIRYTYDFNGWKDSPDNTTQNLYYNVTQDIKIIATYTTMPQVYDGAFYDTHNNNKLLQSFTGYRYSTSSDNTISYTGNPLSSDGYIWTGWTINGTSYDTNSLNLGALSALKLDTNGKPKYVEIYATYETIEMPQREITKLSQLTYGELKAVSRMITMGGDENWEVKEGSNGNYILTCFKDSKRLCGINVMLNDTISIPISSGQDISWSLCGINHDVDANGNKVGMTFRTTNGNFTGSVNNKAKCFYDFNIGNKRYTNNDENVTIDTEITHIVTSEEAKTGCVNIKINDTTYLEKISYEDFSGTISTIWFDYKGVNAPTVSQLADQEWYKEAKANRDNNDYKFGEFVNEIISFPSNYMVVINEKSVRGQVYDFKEIVFDTNDSNENIVQCVGIYDYSNFVEFPAGTIITIPVSLSGDKITISGWCGKRKTKWNNVNYDTRMGYATGGYYNSDVRKQINRDVLFKLPPGIQSSITPVVKQSTIGNGRTKMKNVCDNLFLFSGTEVGCNASVVQVEGAIYPVFTTNDERIILNGSGNRVDWWTRSNIASGGDPTRWKFINANGETNFQSSPTTSRYLVIGFSI